MNNLPRIISFTEIRRGDIVEQTTPDGSKVTIVATEPSSNGRFWYSPDSDQGVTDMTGCTVRLLERPEPPSLPTAWGTIIRIKGGELGGMQAVLVDLGKTVLPWITHDDENGYGWASAAAITDWTVIYDPTAPDAGLRERVEELARGFDSQPDTQHTGRYVAHQIRDAAGAES